MNYLKTEAEVDRFIQQHALSFIYISKENCSVCESLYPQIMEVLQDYEKINTAKIVVDELPSIASKFEILTAPVLLLFIEGKEYLRHARIVPIDLFRDKINELYHLYYE
ncbi:thioredoxin family protein [Gracilibacillus marinus]|uniref:Thioredoxin family protein n=1 Tax=Gracilibacillus marinus TaxID=630535 RepID=A0ABV8VZK4_9BACI